MKETYEYNLNPDWEAHGTSYDDFKKLINEVADATTIINVPNIIGYEYPQKENVSLLEGLTQDGNQNEYHHKLIKSPACPEEKVFFLNYYNNKLEKEIYYLTRHALITLSQKIKMDCDAFFNPRNAYKRNAFLASELEGRISTTDKDVCCIVRTYNGENRIFAFVSDGYKEWPQNNLTSLIEYILSSDSFGTGECKSWDVNQYLTSISYTYPKYAKEMAAKYGYKKEDVIPVIKYSTSDTSDASLSIKFGWLIGAKQTFVLQGEHTQKHYGKVDYTKICNEIQNSLFDEWEAIPNALCDLMSIDVDITEEYLTKLLNKDTEILKICGKKKTQMFISDLVKSIDSNEKYTAYDCYLFICEIRDFVKNNLTDITSDKLERELKKLLFVKTW